jgi:peptidoglycan/LPS O-acetylase OafA/YrhL
VLLGAVFLFAWRMQTVGYSAIALAFAAVVAWGALGNPAILARASVLRRLGTYSYGVYVLHLPVMVYLELTGWQGSPWLLPLVLGVSVALAALSWHAMESRILGQHRPPPLSPQPTTAP